MRNGKKSDDLVFGMFRNNRSEVLQKILVLNIFSNSTKMYFVKFATIYKAILSTCERPLLAIQMIRYCFSIKTDPLNPIGYYFEKIRSQKASPINKKIWLSNKVKCFTENDNCEVWVEIKQLTKFSRLEDHSTKCGPDLQTF